MFFLFIIFLNCSLSILLILAEMLVPGHVCSLYVATGGANGAALGSDEKEIVLLDYSVIDVLTNEVSVQNQYQRTHTFILFSLTYVWKYSLLCVCIRVYFSSNFQIHASLSFFFFGQHFEF